MSSYTVALCAAPNTGKTTLFNRLTGANQTVGNWPGVTVTRKTGHFHLGGQEVELVDLPGAYSLSATSIEERVARDYLLQTPPDAVVNIVDAGNLYRTLGLTLQLAMSGLPLVVAVNMMDEARKQGIEIDFEALQQHLGVPVVPISARSGEGVEMLKKTLREVLEGRLKEHPPHISFPPVLEEAVSDLARKIEKHGPLEFEETFVALRLMEGGDAAQRILARYPQLAEVADEAQHRMQSLAPALHADIPATCAQCRFNAARGLVREAVRFPSRNNRDLNGRIDAVLMHRWLGLPVFLLIMWLMFQGVFALGTPMQDALANGIDWFDGWLRASAAMQMLPATLRSLLLDGLLAGVGVVLSFLPIIVLFFFFLSLIEDSGYMARAAFLMDRLMHALRLDGKAFISLLLGYGCNVPAVMGTRILSSRHNRILAMLMIPFSLCSARLQVFLFLSSILFAASIAPWVVFGLYVLSFVVIVLVGLLLRPFHFGEPEPFIMELPPYRLPLARTVLLRAWTEIRAFINRAATLIVLGVVSIWVLTHLPPGVAPASPESLAGRIGHALAPVFEPLGIHWAETVSLFFGFIAKEILIGSLAVIHGSNDLAETIAATITPLEGLSLMVFTLIYTPCVATLATIRTESASWKVTLLSVALGLALAWTFSFAIYQGGRLLGF